MLHAMKLSYKLCLLRQLRRSGTEVRAKFPESKSATSAVQHILSSHLSVPLLGIVKYLTKLNFAHLCICSFALLLI